MHSDIKDGARGRLAGLALRFRRLADDFVERLKTADELFLGDTRSTIPLVGTARTNEDAQPPSLQRPFDLRRLPTKIATGRQPFGKEWRRTSCYTILPGSALGGSSLVGITSLYANLIPGSTAKLAGSSIRLQPSTKPCSIRNGSMLSVVSV